METVTSNDPNVRLTIKTNIQFKTLDETKLDTIKPVELANAFRALANGIIGSSMYLSSVGGKPCGVPTQTPTTLASANIGDGLVGITRLEPGQYQLTIKRVVEAECYHNGSISRSHKAVHTDDGWQKVG